MVLCVRADGHVSLEVDCGPSTCAQEAGETAAELLRRHHDSAPEDHACCLDIPLPSIAEAPEAVSPPAPDAPVRHCLDIVQPFVAEVRAQAVAPCETQCRASAPPVDASSPILLI